MASPSNSSGVSPKWRWWKEDTEVWMYQHWANHMLSGRLFFTHRMRSWRVVGYPFCKTQKVHVSFRLVSQDLRRHLIRLLSDTGIRSTTGKSLSLSEPQFPYRIGWPAFWIDPQRTPRKESWDEAEVGCLCKQHDGVEALTVEGEYQPVSSDKEGDKKASFRNQMAHGGCFRSEGFTHPSQNPSFLKVAWGSLCNQKNLRRIVSREWASLSPEEAALLLKFLTVKKLSSSCNAKIFLVTSYTP